MSRPIVCPPSCHSRSGAPRRLGVDAQVARPQRAFPLHQVFGCDAGALSARQVTDRDGLERLVASWGGGVTPSPCNVRLPCEALGMHVFPRRSPPWLLWKPSSGALRAAGDCHPVISGGGDEMTDPPIPRWSRRDRSSPAHRLRSR